MKSILKFLFPCVAIVLLLTYSGCGPKPTPEPDLAEMKLGLLSAQWTASSVTLDGVSKTTPDYAAFKLTISGTYPNEPYSYSTAGRPALSPWPSSGSWKFGTDPATQIVRDNGTASQVDMTYTVSETALELTFQYSGNGEARTSNVKGTWVFTFTK